MKCLRYVSLILCLGVPALISSAQNIVGYKIMIGADAPAFIAFPSEVDNARWDNNEMNDYFRFSTRNENTMQISYNGKENPPASGTGFSVIQGKNTHIFTLVFKKDYDINKDPVLYYDFSDKAKLKQAAAGNAGMHAPPAEEDKPAQEKRRLELEKQQQEAMLAQQQRKKELEAQQKAEAAQAKQAAQEQADEVAKAKAEAQRIDQQRKKAQEQEAAIAKANREAERKRTEEALRLKKQQEAEDKRLAAEAEKQRLADKQQADKTKLEKEQAAREEAERKRLAARAEQERLLKERQEKEEAERQRTAALARQEAEDRRKAKEEAEARLAALQQEQEAARKNARYTMAGLWNTYGKKGINLYEIPPGQSAYVNADFYVSNDTLVNFGHSRTFLAEPARLDIRTEAKQDIRIALQGISFEGAIAYYRIGVQNNSADDYLVGANSLAWYNADGSPKVFLKCSYLSYIGFFPLVKPGETASYIYATRAANINADDKLVLTVRERRPEMPAFELLFDGSVYLEELQRVAKPVSAPSRGHEDTDDAPENGKKKKRKKDR